MSYKSLSDFVTALRRREPQAREHLRELYRTRVSRLVEAYQGWRGPRATAKRVVCGILAWLEMLLIGLSEESLSQLEDVAAALKGRSSADVTWKETIVTFGLVAVGKCHILGPGETLDQLDDRLCSVKELASGLPHVGHRRYGCCGVDFEAEWFQMPADEVSGDLADVVMVHGALWVLLADATGHGRLSFVVVEGLRHLWKAILARTCADVDPRGVLQELDRQLQDCLPEEMFVEATLVRVPPDGPLSVAAAGHSRLFFRRVGSSRIEFCRLGDFWLGPVGMPPEEQRTYGYDIGDELTLASDGLFDCPYESRSIGDVIADCLKSGVCEEPLYPMLVGVLKDASSRHPPDDDVTIVAVRKIAQVSDTT